MRQNRGLFRRAVDALLQTRPGTWVILNVATLLDPPLLRATGGRFATGTLVGIPTLLLTTTGAKSGQRRTATLAYFRDGAAIVLIASYGGKARHPGWYYNLRANPEATVLCGRLSGTYRAHEATGAERDRLWALSLRLYSGYDVYERRATNRRIPVMVLVPVVPPAGAA